MNYIAFQSKPSPILLRRCSEIADGTQNITLKLYQCDCLKFTTTLDAEVCSNEVGFELNVNCSTRSETLKWANGQYDIEVFLTSDLDNLIKSGLLTIKSEK